MSGAISANLASLAYLIAILKRPSTRSTGDSLSVIRASLRLNFRILRLPSFLLLVHTAGLWLEREAVRVWDPPELYSRFRLDLRSLHLQVLPVPPYVRGTPRLTPLYRLIPS